MNRRFLYFFITCKSMCQNKCNNVTHNRFQNHIATVVKEIFRTVVFNSISRMAVWTFTKTSINTRTMLGYRKRLIRCNRLHEKRYEMKSVQKSVLRKNWSHNQYILRKRNNGPPNLMKCSRNFRLLSIAGGKEYGTKKV